MTDQLVTIVIPTHNHCNYLPEAINSILSQTHQAWEAIIVDDGSTDDTASTVANYLDSRIGYIYQDNQGLANARNAGINLAKGEYLAFLDADDTWESTFIAESLAKLASCPDLAAVYCGHNIIDDAGTKHRKVWRGSVSPDNMFSKLLEGGFFPPNTVVVRQTVLDETGPFDTGLKGSGTEDWDLWLRVSKSYAFGSVNRCLANYRVTPGSMSQDACSMHKCRFAVLDKHFPSSKSAVRNRAFGYGWFRSAIDFMSLGKSSRGWDYFIRAISVYPDLLFNLDIYFELLFCEQSLIARGKVWSIDIEAQRMKLIEELNNAFSNLEGLSRRMQRASISNLNWACAILSEQTSDWHNTRGYMFMSFNHYPLQIFKIHFVRRFVKLLVRTTLNYFAKLAITSTNAIN